MTSPLLLAANTGPLSTLDIILFLVFVVGVVALGLYQGEKAVQGEDGAGGAAGYFLAGRGLTWWLVGFSLIAANISTEQFVGMSGAAADWLGMAIASYEWMAAITLVVAALVFHPTFGGIFNFIQEFQGFISPGILAVYLFGFLVPRTPRYAGWVGILLNVLLYGALKWFIFPEVAFLNRMAICFGSVVAVLAVITWLRPMATPAVLPTTDLINLESSKSAKVFGIGAVLAPSCSMHCSGSDSALRRVLALLLLAVTGAPAADPRQADVVVYGATAGGVISAIAAAKHGANVVLLEPGNHVGGMLSGGLGRTDMDRQENVIGGLALEFFRRVGRHYGEEVAWTFEPSVAEKVLKEMLAEQKISVEFGRSLRSVEKKNGVLTRLVTNDGSEYRAPVFIDATYEGDLMKAAGVSYAVGREARRLHGESLAGRREILRSNHQVNFPISPWKDNKLLPHITAEEDIVPTGEGDGKLQAYCFRLCLTDIPENRLPVTPPENYDPADYELLRRCFEVGGEKVHGVLGIKRMPNGKSDVNAGAPISLNLCGANQDYPDASPERRKEIWKQHLDWARGLVYFVQNDPSVPEAVRKKYAPWGLCKDEFTDTGGWPHQMYIREARRMQGEHVLTQHDLMKDLRKDDCIGMAGYNIDIREVQWVSLRTFFFPKAEDQVYMEGYVSQPVEPWDIPYRALLPKAAQCRNLLVPVCISASTIANASFRMEPQYMIAGQAAGTAASMAGQVGGDVHRVDVTALQKLLRKDGQILGLSTAPSGAPAGVLEKVNEATRL